MKPHEEGRPSDQEVGARQSARTTYHRTTLKALPHHSAAATPRHTHWHRRPTLSTIACDVIVWAVWVLMIVAILLVFCAALWVVS